MSLIINKYHWFTALLIVATISSCGGGGGGGGETEPPGDNTPAATTSSVSGTASKGIIKLGVITANELTSDGSVLRNVGNTTTDESGDYTLDLSDAYTGGPIELKIQGSSGSTMMVCDVVSGCGANAFGEDVPLDESFILSVLIPSIASSEAVNHHITPYTYLAAQRAREAAVLDSTTIQAANSEVANLLGGLNFTQLSSLDITDTAAVDAANADTLTYAVFNSAIGEFAYTEGMSLSDTLILFGNSFNDGVMRVVDNGEADDDNQISLDEILNAARNQFAGLGEVDATGILNGIENIVASNPQGNVVPGSSPNAGDSDLDKAKAFIADVRSWGMQFSELQSPSLAFREQLRTAGRIVEPSINNLAITLEQAARLMLATYINAAGADGSYPFGSAGTTVITTSAGKQTVTASGELNGDGVALSITFDELGRSSQELVVSVSGRVENSRARFKVDAGELTVTFNKVVLIDPASLSLDDAQIASLTVNSTIEELAVVDPVMFTGRVELIKNRIAPFDPSKATYAGTDLIPTHLLFSGTFSKGTNNFSATASVDFTNIDTNFDLKTLKLISQGFFNFGVVAGFSDVTASITISAQLPDLPLAQVTVTSNISGVSPLEVDDPLGTINLLLAYNGTTLNFQTEKKFDSVTQKTIWSAAISNQDGVVLNIDEEGSVGRLSINGNKVGVVERIRGSIIKISYIDNSFETLN